MNAAGLARFNVIAARVRQALFPADVVPAGATRPVLTVARSASQSRRVRNSTNTGWINLVECTLLFPSTTPTSMVPAHGARYTLHSLPLGPAAEVGTTWVVREFSLGSAGREHRAVCQRVDS